MRRAIAVLRHGAWTPPPGGPSVTLTHNDRQRRRGRLSGDDGEPLLLELEIVPRLRDGDGLTLADGGAVLVRAAPEPVVDIRCESAAHAARVAWHIGNRHAPLQVLADGGLRIQDDHVLAGMAEGLGAATRRRQAPFSPEPGAYAHAASDPGEDRG